MPAPASVSAPSTWSISFAARRARRSSKFGHERLRTFGVGKEHNKNEWRSIFRQLQGAGIIALEVGGYGRWTITEEGHRVLKGAAGVELRKEALAPARQKGPRGATAAALADAARSTGVV